VTKEIVELAVVGGGPRATPWGLGLCTDMAGLNIFRPPEGVL